MVKTTLLKVIFQGSHFTEIDRMVEVKGSVGARVDVRPLGVMISKDAANAEVPAALPRVEWA